MLLQQLVNGLVLGSVYSLVAVGYSLVFGVLELINLSNGAFVILGGYIALMFSLSLHGQFLPAVILSLIITAFVGFLMDRVTLRPIRESNAPKIAGIISTMGVSVIIENFILIFFGTETKKYVNMLDFGKFSIGNAIISWTQVIILIIGILLMVIFSLVIYKTKIGKAMRSTAQNPEAALLMGINVNQIISLTFIISTALAAISGILTGMYYQAIDIQLSFMVGMKTFAAAVLGGVGVIPGAMFGGIIIGISEALGASYISSGFRDAIAFGILIIVLLIKPTGLFGAREINKV